MYRGHEVLFLGKPLPLLTCANNIDINVFVKIGRVGKPAAGRPDRYEGERNAMTIRQAGRVRA